MILSSVRFLARQGLALRGDGSDVSSNLTQLLNVRAEDNPQILQWISKKACKHVHPENQNEIEFVELYYLSVIDAQSIVDAIKDAFLQFQIPFTKLRGQCYDGCSTMTGARAGVAVKIQEVEPRAVFTHCYGHAFNPAVSDTITKVQRMKDCLDTCYEIVKMIKFSPKREAMLFQLKE
ncbi:hypothetical protein EMCRGX_G019467 [Ephydatia muelleri]